MILLFTMRRDLGLIALRSVSLLRVLIGIQTTSDSVYLRAFSMVLFLVCARRATDTDHGDRAVAQAEQRKQCAGQEGGPWAGGSHILYTSILELIIALNSLIKHPLREQNLNKPVVISRTALRRLRRVRDLHSASSTPSSRPSPLQDGDGV